MGWLIVVRLVCFYVGGSEGDKIGIEMEMDGKGLMGGLLFGGLGDGGCCRSCGGYSRRPGRLGILGRGTDLSFTSTVRPRVDLITV